MRQLHQKLDSLTNREREVLSLIGRGLSLPEIARRLHRSQKTVESHRLALGRKLGLNNRVELARLAITAGLAPLNSATRSDEHRLESLRDSVAGQPPAWQAMRTIDAALATRTGHDYLRALGPRLCDELNVRAALVTELSGQPQRRRRHMLACVRGEQHEWWRVPLAGSPCEPVVQHGFARYDDAVQHKFPDNDLLQRAEATSYLGVRLTGAHREPIGVLAILHDSPLDDATQPDAILRICASRAAAELERAHMDEKLLELNDSLERRVQQRTAQLEEVNQQLQQQIAQKERHQRELKQSEHKFRTLVETMKDGLAVMDAQGTFTYVNQAFADMLGHSREELIGHSPTEFIGDPGQAAWFSSREFDRRRGNLDTYRLTIRRANGATFDARVSPCSLFDDDGQYVGSFGIVSPIHEFKPEDETHDYDM